MPRMWPCGYDTKGKSIKNNNEARKEKRNVNKMQEQNGIKITINDRFMYREYEKYNITIKNNTDKTILISEKINSNDICLIDSNEIEYDSMLNEVPSVNLELQPGTEKKMDIRFYKMYNLYRTIESIKFKNIITDKDSYDINKENVSKVNISIDV